MLFGDCLRGRAKADNAKKFKEWERYKLHSLFKKSIKSQVNDQHIGIFTEDCQIVKINLEYRKRKDQNWTQCLVISDECNGNANIHAKIVTNKCNLI